MVVSTGGCPCQLQEDIIQGRAAKPEIVHLDPMLVQGRTHPRDHLQRIVLGDGELDGATVGVR